MRFNLTDRTEQRRRQRCFDGDCYPEEEVFVAKTNWFFSELSYHVLFWNSPGWGDSKCDCICQIVQSDEGDKDVSMVIITLKKRFMSPTTMWFFSELSYHVLFWNSTRYGENKRDCICQILQSDDGDKYVSMVIVTPKKRFIRVANNYVIFFWIIISYTFLKFPWVWGE